MKILVSTGEVSGDIVAARLTREIHRLDGSATVFGIGGSRMAEAGVEIDLASNQLGIVGVAEASVALPSLVRAWLAVARRVRVDRPDVAVLIGNDLFNTLMARWLKSRGIRTLAYFPPQVWVWRSVAGPIARSFDVVLASFPSEYDVYRRASTTTKVAFVGHYLADALSPTSPAERAEARRRLGLDRASRVVGLLPGSRGHEIRVLAPILLDAAAQLLRRDPGLRFVLPVAEPAYAASIRRHIDRRAMSTQVLVGDNSLDAMRSSDLLLLASGTASLEAALLQIPMVIVYRLSWLTSLTIRTCISLGLFESDTVGLPNLVIGRRAVPELTQSRATAPLVSEEAWSILSNVRRQEEIREALAETRQRLTGGACLERVAAVIVEVAAMKNPRDRLAMDALTMRHAAAPTAPQDGRAPEAE